MVDGFVVEGFSLSYRGRGSVSVRDGFLLRGDGVEYLVPLYFYRDGLDMVFVYDLEGGYSLGERLDRGDGDIGVGDFVSILERVDFVSGEYFFDLCSFYVSRESVVYSMRDGGCGLVYCPLYRGDFWGGVLSLFGSIFSNEPWFGEYLNRLEGLGVSFSIGSFVSMVGCFGDGRGSGNVNLLVDGVMNSGVSKGSLFCLNSSREGGNKGSGSSGFGSLLGIDWWGLVVSFICGGVGNLGFVVMFFLFVGFVMGIVF